MAENDTYSLQPGMIDSHFHLIQMEKKGLPAGDLLEDCFRQGLELVMEIGDAPDCFERRRQLSLTYPQVFLASGLYPSECVNPRWPKLIPVLEKHLKETRRTAALGEIGLDYFHGYGTAAGQRELMEAQVDLANSLELPVVIHCRDAEQDILESLKSRPPEKGGIMHCFSSSREWLAPFLDLGFYISFAGNLTYGKNNFLRETAAAVPENRILLETDSPYLSPLPVRGRMNHPGFIGYTYSIMAELRGIPLTDLIQQVRSNFRNFISLSRIEKEKP